MIEFQDVTRRYGATRAIDHLSMKITEPGLYSLLGRNGAGKTTWMKLIAGSIGASEGHMIVDGAEVTTARQPDCVNYIENQSVQFNLKVIDLIEAANRLQNQFDLPFARQMTRRFQLQESKRYNQLSFGMKTMLSTILTLANDSEIILLDEPTLGFDAIMRDQFNTLLYESFEQRPRIIIVSTHLIDEIAKIAQRLIIIEGGRIVLHTDIGDIDERAYVLTGPSAKVLPLLEKIHCIGKRVLGGSVAAYVYDERIAPPEGVTIGRLSLQDFFIQIVGGERRE
jgi:ABC-2 type transport system ATP-binding protein